MLPTEVPWIGIAEEATLIITAVPLTGIGITEEATATATASANTSIVGISVPYQSSLEAGTTKLPIYTIKVCTIKLKTTMNNELCNVS